MILLPSFRQMKLLRYFFVLFSCLAITGLSHAQETSHPKAHKENHLDTFFIIDLTHTIYITTLLLIGQYKDGQGRLICYPKQKLNK